MVVLGGGGGDGKMKLKCPRKPAGEIKWPLLPACFALVLKQTGSVTKICDASGVKNRRTQKHGWRIDNCRNARGCFFTGGCLVQIRAIDCNRFTPI